VAPEVIGGQPPTPATDAYALGIVLYELLCGRSPYRGGGVSEVLCRHASCVPVRPAGFPEPLWPVILDCLAMDPAGRPSTAALAERLHALLPALHGLAPLPPVGADMVTWWPRANLDNAPVFAVRREGGPVPAAPVSPASGDSPRGTGSDLPIAELPTPVVPFGTRFAAAVPVPALAALGSTEPDTPFGPLPALVGPPSPVRSNRRLMAALLGAAALVVVFAIVGAVLFLNAGHKPVPDPRRPVAVTSPQPSTAPSAPKNKPSAPSSAPADNGNGTGDNGNGNGNGDGNGDGNGNGGTNDNGNGGNSNGGGNADNGNGGGDPDPADTTGTVPGIGPSTPG
jgi:serine/threonine-protein kinase